MRHEPSTEDIPKIQESFVQLDDPLQKRYAGTGLGVPLAIAMTKLHGGSLRYESEPGVGTTAILTFPAQRVLDDIDDVSYGNRVLLPDGGAS